MTGHYWAAASIKHLSVLKQLFWFPPWHFISVTSACGKVWYEHESYLFGSRWRDRWNLAVWLKEELSFIYCLFALTEAFIEGEKQPQKKSHFNIVSLCAIRLYLVIDSLLLWVSYPLLFMFPCVWVSSVDVCSDPLIGPLTLRLVVWQFDYQHSLRKG